MNDRPTEEQLLHGRERLGYMQAVLAAIDDPHRVLDLVIASADDASSVDALCREFGFEAAHAHIVLDIQFRRFNERGRLAIANEVEELESWLRSH